MRKRFEQQLYIGQCPIEFTGFPSKKPDALDQLLMALKELYCNEEYNERIFSLLDQSLNAAKQKSGRPGMDLWQLFVLSQVRLCLNTNYQHLCNLSNNHYRLRCILGLERETSFPRIELEYQNIYDNVNLLSDELVRELNAIIVSFGHGEVFKKKEEEALRCKTDSFIVGSNVHFPTDYGLLWDCARKCLDGMKKYLERHSEVKGWRKLKNWYSELKSLSRAVGRVSRSRGKNKEDRQKTIVKEYLQKATALVSKLERELTQYPIADLKDASLLYNVLHFLVLLEKHIDLVDRRLLKGEKIPHSEKLFSIFETYTEMINKGKLHPNVELGKSLSITTDHYDLIIDYQLHEHQQDREILLEIADRVLEKYSVLSWSWDKGYWNKNNKEILSLSVPQVIMPKCGRRTIAEEQEETSPSFQRLKNKHSAIESNINELEHRGLDRCPDRGFAHFKRYIGLGVCAYNLKKIGKEILRQQARRQQQCNNSPPQAA